MGSSSSGCTVRCGGRSGEPEVTPLRDDILTSARWIARALNSSGYRADFTPGSLRDVERFMVQHSDHGVAVAGGLLATGLGPRLFALGTYVGETVRQNGGGAWVVNGDGPTAEMNIALHLPDGSVIWPVQRVVKRFHNGPEDDITFYGAGLGLTETSPRPRLRFRRMH
ncbi:hypothetical protein [Streptomyces sp. NPDC006875]|uniref:hypothetical protein n=1 Tax=Streptomyces sp. NPDC006875 TaxID=3154781 RepID=UPI0033C1A7F1